MPKPFKPLPRSVIITILIVGLIVSLPITFPLALTGAKYTGDALTRKDLGPGFEYVGKEAYGCYFPLCGNPLAFTYYFATDMSEEEVKGYFKKASVTDVSRLYSPNSSYSHRIIFFETTKGQNFGISYYDNAAAIIRKNNLIESTKKHLIIINDDQYKIIRSSL